MDGQEIVDYSNLSQLQDIYLEDSFVLGISTEPTKIEFSLEVVLNKNHSLYKEPVENESYCYRNANLIFTDFDSAKWLEKNDDYFIDASGQTDYGNIDFFHIAEKGFDLSGDWGHLIVTGGTVLLEFRELI